ncbi:NYN domain-containing protein [Duganella guangzhouensis]|nr:NYN domain-containing protein [Duganella guangzhouensis]
MKSVAVFLDAGYFWVQLCKVVLGTYNFRTEVSIDHEALRKIMLAEVEKQFGVGCHFLRVYWYDGPGPSGKTSEHRAIELLDDFKLRLGTRNSIGAQKGVDGLIVADLIGLTQLRAITHALLMTGDSDITPGVVAAQNMGLRVHLLSLGSPAATSPYLAAEADSKHSWCQKETSQFAKAARQVSPSLGDASTALGTQVITKEMFEALATAGKRQIMAGLERDQLSLPSISNLRLLPKEVDSILLTAARKSLGRSLTDPEKRALREAFKRLL